MENFTGEPVKTRGWFESARRKGLSTLDGYVTNKYTQFWRFVKTIRYDKRLKKLWPADARGTADNRIPYPGKFLQVKRVQRTGRVVCHVGSAAQIITGRSEVT